MQTCEHNWTTDNDAIKPLGKNAQSVEKQEIREAHTITTWTDNGNETHSGTCTKCNYKVTSNHNYNSSNKCTDCGEQQNQQQTEKHNWVQKNDTTNHWEECTKCGKKEMRKRTITTWTNNGDETHSGTCTKCNYKVTSNHNYNSSNKCTDCGATKPATDCEHN